MRLFHKYWCKPRFLNKNILAFDLILIEKHSKISQLLRQKLFHIFQHLSLIFFTPLLKGFFKHCISHCSVAKTEILALVFFSFNEIKIVACFWFCSFKEAGSLWIQGVWSFISTSGMIFSDTNKTQEILIQKLVDDS